MISVHASPNLKRKLHHGMPLAPLPNAKSRELSRPIVYVEYPIDLPFGDDATFQVIRQDRNKQEKSSSSCWFWRLFLIVVVLILVIGLSSIWYLAAKGQREQQLPPSDSQELLDDLLQGEDEQRL